MSHKRLYDDSPSTKRIKVTAADPEIQQLSEQTSKNNIILLQVLRGLQKSVEDLYVAVKQQQYAVDALKREVADLQSHAINGTLGSMVHNWMDTDSSPSSPEFSYYC